MSGSHCVDFPEMQVFPNFSPLRRLLGAQAWSSDFAGGSAKCGQAPICSSA
jgi:hypothetical protein